MKLGVKFKDNSVKEFESSDKIYIRQERKKGYSEVVLRDLNLNGLFTDGELVDIIDKGSISISLSLGDRKILTDVIPKETIQMLKYGTLDIGQDVEEFLFVLGV